MITIDPIAMQLKVNALWRSPIEICADCRTNKPWFKHESCLYIFENAK